MFRFAIGNNIQRVKSDEQMERDLLVNDCTHCGHLCPHGGERGN